MAREYMVFGECMVKVRGPAGSIIEEITELGLASESIRLTPRYNHLDILTDDFGPNVPVEVLSHLADANLQMTLVHYDPQILDYCMYLAMGGRGPISSTNDWDGSLSPAAVPLGLGAPLHDEINNYVSVYLVPASYTTTVPYRFPACYLDAKPLEIPFGTERTLVKLNWRVIPYQEFTTGEITSEQGHRLWSHEIA